MIFIHRIITLVPFAVMVGLIVLLEQRCSLGVAASVYAGAVVLATLIGALLLRSTEVGRANWRNVLATRLLPCSAIFGYGSLLKLSLSNLFGSGLIGIIGFVFARHWRHHDYSLANVGGWTIACGLAWLVLIGMVLFLFRQYGKKYYAGASGLRKFLKLIAAPAGALAASVALFVAGWKPFALAVAIIPIAIVFLPISFLLIIIIATKLSGKPFRWN